ncbi:MAG: glycosyltransferase [Mariprofundales bacterium]
MADKKDILFSNIINQDDNTYPHIFFMGTDEFQDRSGIMQALEKFGKVSFFTRLDGEYGQNDPDISGRAANNSKRLQAIFSGLATQGSIPDILITQTWADYIHPQVLSQLRTNYGTVIINIGMDDRHRWQAISPLIAHLDLALTAAPECVNWYGKEGCPALFFPEASDSDIFHPMPYLPKLYDVGFVGGKYGIREKIVQALRKGGVRVTAYGTGWDNGRLALDATPMFFAQSKIILGIGTIGHCSDFYALKMRDFDAPMSGSMYLTHENSDLHQLYNIEKEIITYRTIAECVKKARYYLEHDAERAEVAQKGCKRATTEHTWSRRFAQLFQMLNNQRTYDDPSIT